jgi:hypothetical protein
VDAILCAEGDFDLSLRNDKNEVLLRGPEMGTGEAIDVEQRPTERRRQLVNRQMVC